MESPIRVEDVEEPEGAQVKEAEGSGQIEELKDNLEKIRALLAARPEEESPIEMDEETRSVAERTAQERSELQAALEGVEEVGEALKAAPEGSSRRAELERLSLIHI